MKTEENKKPGNTKSPRNKHLRHYAWEIFWYLLAVGILVWVFHDVKFDILLDQLQKIAWDWMALGIFVHFASFYFMGVRWKYLLRPAGNLSAMRATQAIYIGLFTNEFIPLRVGEFARMYVASQWMNIEFASAFASVAVGRLTDGVLMVIGAGFTAIFISLPSNLIFDAKILGGVVLLFVALFILAGYWSRKSPLFQKIEKKVKGKFLHSVFRFLDQVAAWLNKIGRSRILIYSVLASTVFLLGQFFSVWFLLIGYGIHLQFWAGAVIFLIIGLGTAVPNTPSNVGTYQFFAIVALSLFNVDKTTATGFSVVAYILFKIPIIILGFFALSRSGLTMAGLREKINIFRKNL